MRESNPIYPRLRAIIYCLLIETNKGLVLIDTGIGTQDYIHPSLMMKGFIKLLRVPGDASETAVSQIQALGYSTADVTHIVLTHLHLDHARGLVDFPHALVHVYRPEYEAMDHRKGLLSWGCDKRHFRHGPDWVFHDGEKELWYGLDSLEVVQGLKPNIRLVMLPGHTRGHCGVAVATEKGWLLHCGDAASPYYPTTDIFCLPPEMHRFRLLPAWFTRMLLGPHVERLRTLRMEHEDELDIISAHDIYSFERFQSIKG